MGDHLEQKAEVKRLLLSSETAAITARAREREVETLLQQNQEVIVHSLTHTHQGHSLPLTLSLSPPHSTVFHRDVGAATATRESETGDGETGRDLSRWVHVQCS